MVTPCNRIRFCSQQHGEVPEEDIADVLDLHVGHWVRGDARIVRKFALPWETRGHAVSPELLDCGWHAKLPPAELTMTGAQPVPRVA